MTPRARSFFPATHRQSRYSRPQFETTRWQLVQAARDDPRALAILCQTYWYPLYAYVRQFGHDAEEARDLTQAFFVELLEHHNLRAVRQERGRFRSYLLTALRHYLLKQVVRSRRLKRGGGAEHGVFDLLDAERRLAREEVDYRTPETIFERRWALATLGIVVDRLQVEWDAANPGFTFNRLKAALLGPPPDGYRAWAADLGTTPGYARQVVHRLRGRFRAVFRDVVGETVLTPEAIEQEMLAILRAFEAP